MQNVLDTIEALGNVIYHGIAILGTLIANVVLFIVNFGVSAINVVINFLMESSGYMTAFTKVLPNHLYVFLGVCISAYSLKLILRKFVG